MDENIKSIITDFNIQIITIKDYESLIAFQVTFNNWNIEQKIDYLNLNVNFTTKIKNMFFINDENNLSNLILIIEANDNFIFENNKKYLIFDKLIFHKDNMYLNSVSWNIDKKVFNNFSKQDFKRNFESMLLGEKIKLLNLDEFYYLNKLSRIEIDFSSDPNISFILSFILKPEFIFNNNQNVYQSVIPIFKKQITYIDDFNLIISPYDLKQNALNFSYKLKMPYFFKEKLMFLGISNNIYNDKIFKIESNINKNINRVDTTLYLNEGNLFKSNNAGIVTITSRLFDQKNEIIQIPRININNFIYHHYSSIEFLNIFSKLADLKDKLSIIGLYNSYFEDALEKIDLHINKNNSNILDFYFILKSNFIFSTHDRHLMTNSLEFIKEKTIVIIENINIINDNLEQMTSNSFVETFNMLTSIEQKIIMIDIKINLSKPQEVFEDIQVQEIIDNPYALNVILTLKEKYSFYNKQQHFLYTLNDLTFSLNNKKYPKLNIRESDYDLDPKYFALKFWSIRNIKEKMNFIGIYNDDFINNIKSLKIKRELENSIIIFDFALKDGNNITLKSKTFKGVKNILEINGLKISISYYQKNLWAFLEDFYSSNLEAQLELLGIRNKTNIEGIIQILPKVNIENLTNISFTFIAAPGFYFTNNTNSKTLNSNNFIKYNQILPIPPININLDFFAKEINYINEYLNKANIEEKMFFLGLDLRKYITGVENIAFVINAEQNNKLDIHFSLKQGFFFPNGLSTYFISSNYFLPANQAIATPFIHISNYDQTSLDFLETFNSSNLYSKMKSIGLINQECEKYCSDVEAFLDDQDHNKLLFRITLNKNNTFNFELKEMFLSSFPFRPWNMFIPIPGMDLNTILAGQNSDSIIQKITANTLEVNFILLNITDYILRKNIIDITAQVDKNSNDIVVVTILLRNHVLFHNYKNKISFNIFCFK